ncbi:hypothetical protein M513_11959 [Trichuris suis]|uniref:Uncharacterized protein n=1 Tax=Trichuris suis TaxID=68888 RepID=A0A085LQA4_9BILA|nr:hypothetical protein M513_11959 [Trichuris suis]
MHARHSRQDHQERCAASAEQTRRFTAGDSVYMRSYKEGQKWIPASITGVTGPRSYTLRTSGGVNERRHVDQIRGRPLETNGDPSTEETSDKESPDRDKGEHDDTEQHSTETPECSRPPEPDISKDVREDRPQRRRTRPKRSYKEGEKWIPASITGVTGPRSYTLRTSGGVNERRHIDQIRGRSLETNGDPSTEETSDKESPDRDKGEHDDTEQHSTETPECSRPPEPDISKDVREDRPQRRRTRPKYLDDYV